MPNYVCKGAKLKCSMGSSQSDLNVTGSVYLGDSPMATVMDYIPMMNIMPFGQCKSLLNPLVAAATAANYGILREMPCIPNTVSPWLKGKMDVTIMGQAALMHDCKLSCIYAGVIEIADDGQVVAAGSQKTGTGAVGVESPKCQLCGKPLDDEVHKTEKTKSRTFNLRNNILEDKDIKDHRFYETGYTPQAHHLISRSAIKKWEPVCKSIGYDINCKENGVILPASPIKACQYRVQRHQGGHIKAYYAAVKNLIVGVFDDFDKNCDKATKDKIINDLNNKSQDILNNIKDFKFLLQNDSLNYYKDCTIGCSSALKSGKNKEAVSEPKLKTSVKEIEKARADTTKFIASVMSKNTTVEEKTDETQAAQDNFNKETSNLDVKLICSVGRAHGNSDYTLMVANAE